MCTRNIYDDYCYVALDNALKDKSAPDANVSSIICRNLLYFHSKNFVQNIYVQKYFYIIYIIDCPIRSIFAKFSCKFIATKHVPKECMLRLWRLFCICLCTFVVYALLCTFVFMCVCVVYMCVSVSVCVRD